MLTQKKNAFKVGFYITAPNTPVSTTAFEVTLLLTPPFICIELIKWQLRLDNARQRREKGPISQQVANRALGKLQKT